MRGFVIVDDHPLYRTGLSRLIEQKLGLPCTGEASSIAEAMPLLEKLRPAVAIVDISLQKESGLELVARIKADLPDVKVLVVSMHDENLYGERAIKAGARGYVMKHEDPEVLIDAIRTILKGRLAISENLQIRMVESVASGVVNPTTALTDREFEVFSLIGKGYGAADIADRLNVSVKTVNSHQDRIKARLGLLSASELRRFAVEWISGH